MTTIIAYIFYFIAATISPLQRRWLSTSKTVEHEGQIDFAFKTALVVAILSLALPFFQPFHLQGNVSFLALIAIFCGIFGAAYWISLFSAQKHVEAGVTTLVLNIYTPVTIILATLFLNEKLTMIQLFGTILLLIGMVVVSKQHQTGRFTFDKYFMMVLASGIFLGVALTLERVLLKTTGFTAGTLISWWTQLAVLGLAVLFTKSRCKYSNKDILVTGSLRFLQSLSWVILLVVVGNLSVASSVTTFKVVFIFIAAAIFLNERTDLPRKIFGSFVAFVGLLLMA